MSVGDAGAGVVGFVDPRQCSTTEPLKKAVKVT